MPWFIYTPLAPPEIAGAFDDEFADSSWGIPAGWSESDFDNNTTVTEDEAGLVLAQPSVATDSVSGIYIDIPEGDFTIWTKVSSSNYRLSGAPIAGLALYQDGSSSSLPLVAFVLRSSNTAVTVEVQNWSDYNTFASTPATPKTISVDVLPNNAFLRIRFLSGTLVYSFDYSTDGIGWEQVYSSTISVSPNHIGLIINNQNTTKDMSARFPFFRYLDSDIGVDGVVLGNRVVFTTDSSGAVSLRSLSAFGSAMSGDENSAIVALPALTALALGSISPAGEGTSALPLIRGQGSGISGTVINYATRALVWMPDISPLVPSVHDDEFADASLGIPDGWTEFDYDSNTTIVETSEGLRVTQSSNASLTSLAGVYKSIPAGDFTIWTKAATSFVSSTGAVMVGLALFQNATSKSGDIVTIDAILDTGQAGRIGANSYISYSVAGPTSYTDLTMGSRSILPSAFYFRIRRTGTTYSFDFSTDGIGWARIYTGSISFIPLHYGLVMTNVASGEDISASFSFFRYVDSDVEVGGLMYGDRVQVNTSGNPLSSGW